jgi:endoglycosylceramidase
LYNNTDGLADSFAEVWKTIAAHMINETNIIGYELLNEPDYGDYHSNPFL